MGAFGEKLRRQRELRGVSLDEISRTTKIGTRLLRALEDEQFDRLPGGIFNKGFVRAYAKHVGINEEEAVSEYLEAAGQGGDADMRTIAEQNSSPRYSRRDANDDIASRRNSIPLVTTLVVIVVAVAAAGSWQFYKDRLGWGTPVAVNDSPPANVPVGGTQPQASLSTENAGASPGTPGSNTIAAKDESSSPAIKDRTEAAKLSHPAAAQALPGRQPAQAVTSRPPEGEEAESRNLLVASNSPESAPTPFEVVVRAKDRAWVSIKSDGKIMVRGIIKPPDIKTIHATDEVVLWTGNAADVEVSFNGRDVPLTGGQNDERVLVFNARGLLPSQAPQ